MTFGDVLMVGITQHCMGVWECGSMEGLLKDKLIMVNAPMH